MNFFYKIILISTIILTTLTRTFSQEIIVDFVLLDSLMKEVPNNTVLKIISDYHKYATAKKDTAILIKTLDYYAKYFEIDTLNNAEKKFLLQKISLLKKYSHYHPKDTFLLYDLYNTYKRLAIFYEKQTEVYTAIEIYYRMLFISQNLKDKKFEARTYRLIGGAYHYINIYIKALDYYYKSIIIAREAGDSSLVFENMLLTGTVNYITGSYAEAIQVLYAALYIAEYLDDNYLKSLVYNQIARIFFDLEYYSKASEFTEKSLEIIENNNFQTDLNSNGVTYLFCGKNYYELGDYKNALICYEKAMQIFLYTNNRNFLSDVYSNLGQLFSKTGDYKQAEEYFAKAFLIRKKIGIEIDIAESYLAFGIHYKNKKDYVSAKFNLINCYKLSKKINNLQYLKVSSQALYEIYKLENNYTEALKYLESFKSTSDSIFKQNSMLYVEKIEVEQQYKLNRIELEKRIDVMDKANIKTKIYIILLSIFLFTSLMFVIFFIHKSIITSKQQNLIEKQKQIIFKQYERFKNLSLVASHTNNSIFIMDNQGKISWVNEALLNLYNTNNNAIFQEQNADFKKLTHYKNPQEIFDVCITKRKPFMYISEILHDEKKMWIQTQISPIIENDIVTGLIGIETDITQIKKAEREIEKQKKDIEYKNKLMEIYNQELKQQKESIVAQNEELRQQQEELKTHTELLQAYNLELQRLSVVASETDNVIYIFDLTGKLLWINNAFTKHTGFTFEEFIERNGDNILSASTFPDIGYYFYVCVEQKKSVKYVSEFTTKYGKRLWVQTTLSPIMDKDSNVKEIIAVDSDITEIKEAEQKISIQNHEIKSSLEYAGRIQKSVLPLPIFIEAVFENYFVFNRPRDIVSGDFYFLNYINDKAIIALADSTGHGIPGAFMSLLGTMAFKIVMSKINFFEPNIILKMLNSEMIRLLHQRGAKNETADSIDIAICSIDLKNKRLDFAGANIPLYIVRKNETNEVVVQRIKPSKVTIGYDQLSKPFTVHSLVLNKGDKVYMSSDGLVDQFGGKHNKKLKRIGFIDLLKNVYNIETNQQEEYFENFLKEWTGPNEQIDDILVLGFEM